ncbi:MAG: hypothetical protein AAB408_03585 [Patescibacteria group bacterium]
MFQFFNHQKNQFAFRGEFQHLYSFRIVNIIVISLYAFAVSGVLLFIYARVYQTIEKVDTITALQSSLPPPTIEFDRLERVNTAWEKKHADVSLTITRDPFLPTATSTAGE